MSAYVTIGECPTANPENPLPAKGFPEGRVRFRIRPDSPVLARVKTADGIREFYVKEEDGHWMPLMEKARNITAEQRSTSPPDHRNHIEAFTRAYTEERWGPSISPLFKGSSGPGATVGGSLEYIGFLRDFIQRNGVRSVADLGCGDWRSGPAIYDGLDASYAGYDAYFSLVQHLALFKPESGFFEFTHLDFFHDFDRVEPADLLLMKDVFQHWPNGDIHVFFTLLRSRPRDFKWLLCVNDLAHSQPGDIAVGEYRPLSAVFDPLARHGGTSIAVLRGHDTKEAVLFDLR